MRAGVVSLLGVMGKEWWGGVVCSYEDYFLQYYGLGGEGEEEGVKVVRDRSQT